MQSDFFGNQMNTTQIGGVAESHRLNTQTDFKGSVSPPKSFVRVSLRVTCSLWDHVCYIVTFVYRCANIFTHSADGKSSQIPLAEKKRKKESRLVYLYSWTVRLSWSVFLSAVNLHQRFLFAFNGPVIPMQNETNKMLEGKNPPLVFY